MHYETLARDLNKQLEFIETYRGGRAQEEMKAAGFKFFDLLERYVNSFGVSFPREVNQLVHSMYDLYGVLDPTIIGQLDDRLEVVLRRADKLGLEKAEVQKNVETALKKDIEKETAKLIKQKAEEQLMSSTRPITIIKDGCQYRYKPLGEESFSDIYCGYEANDWTITNGWDVILNEYNEDGWVKIIDGLQDRAQKGGRIPTGSDKIIFHIWRYSMKYDDRLVTILKENQANKEKVWEADRVAAAKKKAATTAKATPVATDVSAKKEDKKMTDKNESNVWSAMWTTVKQDVADGTWRTAAHQAIKVVREPAIAYMKTKFGSGAGAVFAMALDTEIGEGIFALSATVRRRCDLRQSFASLDGTVALRSWQRLSLDLCDRC